MVMALDSLFHAPALAALSRALIGLGVFVAFWIAAAGLEGIVGSIDLRYTTLTAEDRGLLLPNAMLFTDSITVYEASAPNVDQ